MDKWLKCKSENREKGESVKKSAFQKHLNVFSFRENIFWRYTSFVG